MSIRAVVLENNAIDAAEIRKSLQKLGIRVHVTGSPKEVMDEFGDSDLFLIDIELDETEHSALDAIRFLKMRAPQGFVVVYSQYADQPAYRLSAQGEHPDMLLLKGSDRDKDAIAMITGYSLHRLEAIESEQAAVIFLSARIGLYALIWACGTFLLTLPMLPWLSTSGWLITWAIVSLHTWMLWTAHSGEKRLRVAKSQLFIGFLAARKWLVAFSGAVALKIFVDLLMKNVLRHNP